MEAMQIHGFLDCLVRHEHHFGERSWLILSFDSSRLIRYLQRFCGWPFESYRLRYLVKTDVLHQIRLRHPWAAQTAPGK